MFTSNEWDRLAEGLDVTVYPQSDGVKAEFVHFEDRKTDMYGEYYQDEGEIYVVFKVGDKYYRKNGYKSSYGDVSWDGGVREAQPKTVTVWS